MDLKDKKDIKRLKELNKLNRHLLSISQQMLEDFKEDVTS